MRLFSDSASDIDDPYLSRAYTLALRGSGRTHPNPMVGCVIAAEGRIVGEGFHPQAGEPHAEVFALADAGDAALGATAYITLEPCSHHGRTPPCADALIQAGVAEVVIGMRDPSSEAGGGAEKMLAAGIRVTMVDDPAPYAELNSGWLKRLATGRPFVTAKVGTSIDGCSALAPGCRSDMTGASGSRVTMMLRSSVDAVVVGASTVDTDDPALTVRGVDGALASRQPVRIVIAGSTLPSSSSRVFNDGAADTVVVAPDSLPGKRVGAAELVHYDSSKGLDGAFEAMGELGFNDVLVETGPRLLGGLWSAGDLDRLVHVQAGGMAGYGCLAMFDGRPDAEDSEALALLAEPEDVRVVGDVVVVTWRLRGRTKD